MQREGREGERECVEKERIMEQNGWNADGEKSSKNSPFIQ